MTTKKKETQNNFGEDTEDIIQIILREHKPLKEMLKILKDEKYKYQEKVPVYEEFAPALLRHAEPEQQSLYFHMRDHKLLRVPSFEGETEHNIAGQLIDEINLVENEDEWMAKVKVLAELVESHIEEEENEMFTEVKKELDLETRIQIGKEYRRRKNEFETLNPNPSKKTSERRVS